MGPPFRFAQNTGPFSTQAIAIPGLATIDADVTGSLSFVGPTDVIDIASDQFASDLLTEHVRFSGALTVKQGTHALFDGTFSGSGTASVLYTNRFGPSSTICWMTIGTSHRSRLDARASIDRAAWHRRGVAGRQTAEAPSVDDPADLDGLRIPSSFFASPGAASSRVEPAPKLRLSW